MLQLNEPRRVRRLIDVVAVIAFATVVLRTSLQGIPQLFPGGARIGEVLSQLSVGYLGAWLFHLLVIVLPRRSDQRLIFRTCDRLIHVASGTGFLVMIFAVTEEQFIPNTPDRDALRRACKKVNPNARARSGGVKMDRLGRPVPISWLEYVEQDLEQSGKALRDLQPFYPYLDAETIALLNEVSSHFLRILFDGTSKFGPIGHDDFSPYEKYMFEYWELCNRLTDHRMRHIAPLARGEA